MSDTKESADDFDIEIEVVDDTPLEHSNLPVAPEQTKSDKDISVSDDEVNTYSKNVQKRIKDLSAKAHAERRAKELLVLEQQKTVELAQRLYEENLRLKKVNVSGEQALIGQAKARTEAQIEGVKKAAKEAFEAGDTEKFLNTQEHLHRLVSEHEKYVHYVPPQVQEQPAQLPQAPTVVVDPKAKVWAERNQWFDSPGELEEDMTSYAYAVSDRLIHKRRVDPKSDEYYEEIDRAVRSRFPEYFKSEETEVVADTPPPVARQTQASNVVAPVARTSRATNKVVLSASQVRLARRFGLTNEQYAAQFVKDYGHG